MALLRFAEHDVAKKEGTRRVGVVLKVVGWLSIGVGAAVVLTGAVLGRMSSVGDGAFLLPILGGVALAAAYVLGGFAETDN